MAVLVPQQDLQWDSNVYVLAVTRVFIMMGVIFLIRNGYHIVRRLRPMDHRASVASKFDHQDAQELHLFR